MKIKTFTEQFNRHFSKAQLIVFTSLCVFFCFFCLSNSYAGFDNSGTMQSNELNLNTNTLNNDGKLIGLTSINIQCDSFSGKGYMKSPNIKIIAKEFLYKGTIECSKECIIITAKPFKHDMFKHAGAGSFKFEVDPNI